MPSALDHESINRIGSWSSLLFGRIFCGEPVPTSLENALGSCLQSRREASTMLEEFKKFAMRGNVVDLAVGVIIGAAFGQIVTSLVGDIFMPIIGAATGGLDFSN